MNLDSTKYLLVRYICFHFHLDCTLHGMTMACAELSDHGEGFYSIPKWRRGGDIWAKTDAKTTQNIPMKNF